MAKAHFDYHARPIEDIQVCWIVTNMQYQLHNFNVFLHEADAEEYVDNLNSSSEDEVYMALMMRADERTVVTTVEEQKANWEAEQLKKKK